MKRLSVFLLLAAAACTGTTDNGTNAAVQILFATAATPAPLAASVSAPENDTTVVGTDTLVLSSVEVVLREIKLRKAGVTTCPTTADDDCEEFEAGPVIVTLPLTPGAEQRFALTDVPAATYDRVEFEVHKPEDGTPEDLAFIALHPDFEKVSIRVRGTFNGQTFEYLTDLDVGQELDLNPALVVADGASTKLTVFVNVKTWFTVLGALVNPTTANKGGVNEGPVKSNIERSFRAFEDSDGSGSDG